MTQIETERKYLIEMPAFDLLEQYPDYEQSSITQIYLSNIYIYYLARKEEPICVLPVKKVCWCRA